MDLSLLRAPREIARHVIGEPGGDPVVEEDGRAVKLPGGIAPPEATGVMPRCVESSPQN